MLARSKRPAALRQAEPVQAILRFIQSLCGLSRTLQQRLIRENILLQSPATISVVPLVLDVAEGIALAGVSRISSLPQLRKVFANMNNVLFGCKWVIS